MDKDMAEIYANLFHWVCVICGKNFSRDDVREIKDGEFTKFICDGCVSAEVNFGVHGEKTDNSKLWDSMMSPVKRGGK